MLTANSTYDKNNAISKRSQFAYKIIPILTLTINPTILFTAQTYTQFVTNLKYIDFLLTLKKVYRSLLFTN